MPEVNCRTCGRAFVVKPNRLRRGWGAYCSKPCQYRGQVTGETKKCDYCGKDVYRKQADLRKSTSGRHFCDRRCRCAWANTQRARENHPNWTNGQATYRTALLRSSQEPLCGRCGLTDPRVLAVHHLDGDRANNDLRNLTWLCHNCHYLVHHFPDERAAFTASLSDRTARHRSGTAGTLGNDTPAARHAATGNEPRRRWPINSAPRSTRAPRAARAGTCPP
jgi:hypothetical protein